MSNAADDFYGFTEAEEALIAERDAEVRRLQAELLDMQGLLAWFASQELLRGQGTLKATIAWAEANKNETHAPGEVARKYLAEWQPILARVTALLEPEKESTDK